jgi:SAM-dependent methyltransferase
MIRFLALPSLALLPLLGAGTALAAGPLAPPGAPADAFPKPDRPVAEIVAPRWSSEGERDRAGEFEAVAKGMGINPAYLAALEKRVAGLANVTVVQGEPHDPRLPASSVDAAILVHMYHEITQPFGLLHNLASAMRPGGRVGIVDADAIPSRHGTPPALLRCELTAAGFRETGFHPLKDGAYLAIFTAPAPDARPRPEAIRPCRDAATPR